LSAHAPTADRVRLSPAGGRGVTPSTKHYPSVVPTGQPIAANDGRCVAVLRYGGPGARCSRRGDLSHELRLVGASPTPPVRDSGRVGCDSRRLQGRTPGRVPPARMTTCPGSPGRSGRGAASAASWSERRRTRGVRNGGTDGFGCRDRRLFPRVFRQEPEPHERDRLKHAGRLEEGQTVKVVRNGEGGATAGVEARNEDSGATGDGLPFSLREEGLRRTLRLERRPAGLLVRVADGTRRARRRPEPHRRLDGNHRGWWKGDRFFGTGSPDPGRGGECRPTPEWEDDCSSAVSDVGRVLRDTACSACRSGEPRAALFGRLRRARWMAVTGLAFGRARWRAHARHAGPSGSARRTNEREDAFSGVVKGGANPSGNAMGVSCLSGRADAQSMPSIRRPIRRLSGSGGYDEASGWLVGCPFRGK
jgi:hypothetical protein